MSEKNVCFVCDIPVTSRYFSLATCRTQSSKKKVVERLGYLVGEKYMVVITEDDVICRSCANLMNTLDRLEVEMASVKRVVLRFLERKYSFEEGALLNQTQTKDAGSSSNDKTSMAFMMRKKKSELEMDTLNESIFDDPRSKIWMQCNKCQYTTNYKTFINNHVRKEVCLNCEAPLKDNKCSVDCESEIVPINNVSTQLTTEQSDLSNLVEVNGSERLTNNGENVTLTDELGIVEKNELIGGVISEEDADNSTPMYFQVVDPDQVETNVKQVFTLTNDGSVEMMEVLWNEDENEESVHEIQFTGNSIS